MRLMSLAVLSTTCFFGLLPASASELAWKTPTEGSAYFTGTWAMSIQPSPHVEIIDGEPYLEANPAAALDDLQITADQHYAWKMDGKVYEGEWRNAKSDELHLDKLPGIVLMNARGGDDWIVTETASACSVKRLDADKAWCETWVGGMFPVDEINLRPVGWGAPSFDGARTAAKP